MSFVSSFRISLFLTWFVFQLGCKFFLDFSLLVYPYNDPPFTPLTPNLPYQGSRGSLGNKLINVKFRTITLRQSKLNKVDDQRIIFLLFRINLPTFLILGFVVMKVKRVNFRSWVFNYTVGLETRYTRPLIPVDSPGKNCIPVGLIKHSVKKKS